jgi:hypothetical protein
LPRFAAPAKPRVPGISQGRVDPFRSYPVPWEPFIPELVDHCLYLHLPLIFHLHFTKIIRSRQHGSRSARAR